LSKKQWSKEKLSYFKNIIIEKREKIMDDIADSKERADEMIKGDTVNAVYSSHMADAGSDQQEREKAFYWLTRENSYFQYLNRALDMIADGSFGLCKVCGELINEERLMEVPHTTKCFDCKSNQT
tara:strand:+ start:4956 stop:5330 length:375 start_codon:yes stop_codon:yes gene_type:complete